jgi:hypothetical protein
MLLPFPDRECGALLNHPPLRPVPDRQAVLARILAAAREAGLSARESTRRPEQPEPAQIYFDVTDAGGTGGLYVRVERFLRPESITPQTAQTIYTCLVMKPVINDYTTASRLPDGSSATIGNCAHYPDSHDCSPVTLFSTNGIAVQIVGKLFAFSTAAGDIQPRATRDTEPLTVPQMLQLAQAIAAVAQR